MTDKTQPRSSGCLESPGKERQVNKQLQHSVINATWQMNVGVLWSHTRGTPHLALGGAGQGTPNVCAETWGEKGVHQVNSQWGGRKNAPYCAAERADVKKEESISRQRQTPPSRGSQTNRADETLIEWLNKYVINNCDKVYEKKKSHQKLKIAYCQELHLICGVRESSPRKWYFRWAPKEEWEITMQKRKGKQED